MTKLDKLIIIQVSIALCRLFYAKSLWEKVQRTSKKSKIFVTNSLHRAIAYIPLPSPLLLLLASVAATVRFAIWFLRKCTKRTFLLMLIEGRFNK